MAAMSEKKHTLWSGITCNPQDEKFTNAGFIGH
jgi:hypothetical protein